MRHSISLPVVSRYWSTASDYLPSRIERGELDFIGESRKTFLILSDIVESVDESLAAWTTTMVLAGPVASQQNVTRSIIDVARP
jgi:hypothetical protein